MGVFSGSGPGRLNQPKSYGWSTQTTWTKIWGNQKNQLSGTPRHEEGESALIEKEKSICGTHKLPGPKKCVLTMAR